MERAPPMPGPSTHNQMWLDGPGVGGALAPLAKLGILVKAAHVEHHANECCQKIQIFLVSTCFST